MGWALVMSVSQYLDIDVKHWGWGSNAECLGCEDPESLSFRVTHLSFFSPAPDLNAKPEI